MTQYLMRKEKDFENLKNSIDLYDSLLFHVSPSGRFSKNKEIVINESLEGKKLDFYFDNGIIFLSDKKIIYLPLVSYDSGFKMEYRTDKNMRIYPYNLHPNDPDMPEVKRSVLRNVIDGLLIEISFKGKIILEYDDHPKNLKNLMTNFWKVSKKFNR
ncbi:MAG: hypothetical protein NUV46_02800 [Nanoarchaeota archaeon]|nr:hypothetical protein [Nanoarchaeota archaeon]